MKNFTLLTLSAFERKKIFVVVFIIDKVGAAKTCSAYCVRAVLVSYFIYRFFQIFVFNMSVVVEQRNLPA